MGDVNGFLGLALDNTTNLVILASLLIGVFGFPADLVLGRMLPGTALGVLVGDLAYTAMDVRLARRTGRVGASVGALAALLAVLPEAAVAPILVFIGLGGVLGALGRSAAELTGEAAATYRALLVLGNGFILTAVLWGSAVVFIIERRPRPLAVVFAICSLATLVGLVHSPLPSGAVFWPWTAGAPLAVAAPLAGADGVLSALALLAAAQARTR